MPAALVFGASGQIGRALLPRLQQQGWDVVAVSRETRHDHGTSWIVGALEDLSAVPGRFDVVFSCGPLDRFAAWYAKHGTGIPRVVAFGSTSVSVKQDSADAGERDVAARLAKGETVVFEAARRFGAAATILRPTLVYGGGTDHTLSRVAALARRWRLVPIPVDATGLRQPVHVDDLASAAMAVLDVPGAAGCAYALPGGEALPWCEMVSRVVATLDPPSRVLPLPAGLFRMALALARMTGAARGFGGAVSARLGDDLVFDPGPAAHDFGYAPRSFQPGRGMFDAPR